MFNMLWPIALVVFANIFYQVAAKSVPETIDPFASLTVTYLIAAAVSTVFFFVFNRESRFFGEMTKLNWASIILGLSVVGLEVGFIYAYKAGWQVSTASIVQSSVLSVALTFVGYFAYNEALTWNKVVGITVCLVGLMIINIK